MANVNLSGYTLNELKILQDDVEKAIKSRQQDDVLKAREQILAIAKNIGISVEELLAAFSKKVNNESARKVQPRYRNPTDTSQTWTGRGRQPRWLSEALVSGRKLDDFRME